MAGTIAMYLPMPSEVDLPSSSDVGVSLASTPSESSVFSDVPLFSPSALDSEREVDSDSSGTRVDSEEHSHTCGSDACGNDATFLDTQASVRSLIREAFGISDGLVCSGSPTPSSLHGRGDAPDESLVSHELDTDNDRRPWRSRRTQYLERPFHQCIKPDVDMNYFTFVSNLCKEHIPPNQGDSPSEASVSDIDSLDDSDRLSDIDGLSEEDLLEAFEEPDAVDRFADDMGFLADISSDSDDSDDSDDDYDYDPEGVEYVSERVTPIVMTLCAITEEERIRLALGLYDISRFMRPAFLTANGEIREEEEPAPAPTPAPQPVPTFGLGLAVPPRASFGRSSSFESVNLDDDDDDDEAPEDRDYEVVRPASPAMRGASIASPILLSSPATRPPFFAVDEKDAPLLPISGIATAIATALREVMGVNEPGAVLPDRD
ncbi:hypothetical protein C8Q80DRAFT_1119833 [Daedaleopsis nitida]|nr:hypothetical protein C8Q80DRAFT_1119833 [Daedaleopsis nitida]